MSKSHLIFPSSNAISSVKPSIVLIARMEFILTSLTSKAFLYTYLSLLFLLCICFIILCKTEISLCLRLYSVQFCSSLLFLIHQSNLIFIENLVFPFEALPQPSPRKDTVGFTLHCLFLSKIISLHSDGVSQKGGRILCFDDDARKLQDIAKSTKRMLLFFFLSEQISVSSFSNQRRSLSQGTG